MMGGTLIAFLGGLHYWWPKMFGRRYSEAWGRLAALLIFVGFNVTFFTQFFMGIQGMPRRYFNYPAEFTVPHQVSTYGSYFMGLGFVLIAVYLIHSLLKGKPAPANPWGGATMEWKCSSPPPHHNFDEAPAEHDPYHFSPLRYDAESDSYLPADGGSRA